MFAQIYQKEFEARLSLSDATAKIKASTPFASANVEAFSCEEDNVSVVSLSFENTEDLHLRACLERYGSRSFQYWFIRYSPDASIGLDGTDCTTTKSAMCISQKMGKKYFAIAVLPVSGQKLSIKKNGKHKAEAEFKNAKIAKYDSHKHTKK